jgi:restriction system protein
MNGDKGGSLVARRRGFFAELQYQSQQAEKRRRQQAAAAYRAQLAAQRQAERLRLASERARAAAGKAAARERDRMEKEAARLYVESQIAEAESRNAELAQVYEEIDGILATTLGIDDYIDLESMKVTTIDHPPFRPGPVGTPTPGMPELVYPPEPIYQEPPAPKGIFGAKKKHAELITQAQAEHERVHQGWSENNTAMYNAHVAEARRREETERWRLERLRAAEAQYKIECQQREAEAARRNQELDKLISNLAFDVESAIQEYVGIVLSNSVYPDAFPVSYDHEFDLSNRELRLTVTVPQPSDIPAVKEYKYVKAKDEITATLLPVKARKDRYAGAIHQVAVRSLHEIFEADCGGKIHSISLTVGTEAVSPATGLSEAFPLVVVAADRDTFGRFDLANVVPRATLEHLGAAVSKSPFDLTAADTSRGVRARRQ